MYINTKTGCIAAGGINNPEVRLVGEKKTPLFKFSIAVGKKPDGTTMWINCQAWNPIAINLGSHIKKGERWFVAGIWESREYVDKIGEVKTSNTLTVDALIDGGGHLVGAVKTFAKAAAGQEAPLPGGDVIPPGGNPFGGDDEDSDDLPF
jgi:single-stranded DNA-binding protein